MEDLTKPAPSIAAFTGVHCFFYLRARYAIAPFIVPAKLSVCPSWR
jgi:hypothetical protein